jgi:hypothetical protein
VRDDHVGHVFQGATLSGDDDVVVTLRLFADLVNRGAGMINVMILDGGWLGDAADEVERLRAAGDALVAAIVAVSAAGPTAEMDALTAAHDAWQEARREQ